MQKYLVANVYRDQGDEGTPTFCDPQIVWGVSAKSACKAGRYPNSTDKEGRLWGAPEALAIVGPDGKLSYLSHYDYRMVDKTYNTAIDYTKESAPSWDIMESMDKRLSESVEVFTEGPVVNLPLDVQAADAHEEPNAGTHCQFIGRYDMNNPWIEAGLNAKAYFEAYRALCRMRISYSRRSSALLAAQYISATIDGATMGRRKLFWSRNEKYWTKKLTESFKREKDYLNGGT